MKAKKFLRLLCICLVAILSVSILTGCKSRKLSPDSLSKKEVGTVGDYTVYYDELYTVASLSRTEGITEDELWNIVEGKLIENYAKLILCEEYGVEYDEKELKDDIQNSVDSMINESFGEDRDAYLDALDGMSTDRYTRFNIKTELLYSQLPNAIAVAGDMSADTDTVIEYIENNFVRTKHFMVANSEGEDKDKNFETATAALNALRNGKTTINALIGGKYKVDGKTLINEDLLIPIDGYSFGKGIMDSAYEKAAYSLEVGEFSEVISARGEISKLDGSSDTVDCYYVIERLPLTEDFIKENYDALYETYSNVIVQEKLSKKISELEFKPNGFADGLDILKLEPMGVGIDVTLIVIVAVSVLAAAGITVAVIFIVRHIRKKKSSDTKALKKGR